MVGPATPTCTGRVTPWPRIRSIQSDHRLRFEDELGGDRHVGVGLFGPALLPQERLVDEGEAAVLVDVGVAFGMAGDVDPFEPVEEPAIP